MRFTWSDYGEEYFDLVESWLDDEARRMMGFDDGDEDTWRAYYEYWIHDELTRLGENYWHKIVSVCGKPFAVMAVFLTGEKELSVSEYLVAPDMRNKGYGSAALTELLNFSDRIIGKESESAKAVIYPNNIASQKAFVKAGFQFESAHPDGDAWYYSYRKQ